MMASSAMPKTQRYIRAERQGWVTLVKDGAELVAERPRLNAGERQKHIVSVPLPIEVAL